MKIDAPRNETEAKRLKKAGGLESGWHPARIVQAEEKTDSKGKPSIEVTMLLRDAEGNERLVTDCLFDTPTTALKLLHAVEAVSAGTKYRAGEIEASDFEGDIRIKIIVGKQKGFVGMVKVEDYAAPQKLNGGEKP